MEEACTFIVSNFLRCKGRNNIVKCKNILLLNKIVRKVLLGGVCKTPVHNIPQKRLIIRIINFAKGASRTGRKLWQSVAM